MASLCSPRKSDESKAASHLHDQSLPAGERRTLHVVLWLEELHQSHGRVRMQRHHRSIHCELCQRHPLLAERRLRHHFRVATQSLGSLEANLRRTRSTPWTPFPIFPARPCSSWTIGAFPSILATLCLLSPLPRRLLGPRKQCSTSRPHGPPPRRKPRAFPRFSPRRIPALPRVLRCTRRHWNRGNITKTWPLHCCNDRRACSFSTLPQRRCCTRWRFLCMNLFKWFIRSGRLATSQK